MALLNGDSQVSTLYIQCILLFSIVWGLCSVLVNDSRKAFDVYFRDILNGNNEDYPKPKGFKLTKQQIFPDRATVFDWAYDKKNNGSWIMWMDTLPQVFKKYANINLNNAN